MFFLKTKNGYKLDQVVSALQKTIRRGLEEQALFWALEMCPDFEQHLWNRLLIIGYEDISALVPGNVVVSISTMRDDYFFLRSKGNSGALLVLSNAILLMCRSDKSRVGDNFLISFGNRLDDGYREEIPNFALDKHTGVGRSMKRAGKHFVEQGSIIEPPSKTVADKYKDEAEKRLNQNQFKIQAFAWAKEKRSKRSKAGSKLDL
jgi:replication-associated recombination protein RarA